MRKSARGNVSILDLTTIDRAIAYMGSTGQGIVWTDGNKAVLSSMITALSQAFEQYSSHGFMLEERSEARVINTDFLLCYGWPVQSVSAVSVSMSGKASECVPWADFEVAPNKHGIKVYGAPRGSLVQYTYLGGLADNTADLISSHPNLEDCLLLQLVSEWKRHTMPDRTGVDLGGTGNTQWNGEIKLLAEVTMRLRQEYVSQVDFL